MKLKALFFLLLVVLLFSGNPSQPAFADASDLVISEIMYDPASTPDSRWEYVEIYNTGPTAVDLTGFVLDDDDGLPVPGIILGGTVPAGGTAVLFNAATTPLEFLSAWGAGVNAIPVPNWPILNNSGDRIGLWASITDYGLRNWANAIDEVEYDNGNGWPTADGESSIYLLNGDNDVASNWALSVEGVDGAYRSNPAGFNEKTNVGSPGAEPTAITLGDLNVGATGNMVAITAVFFLASALTVAALRSRRKPMLA